MSSHRFRSIRKPSEFIFADISIETEIVKLELCPRRLKVILMSALRAAFGDCGLAIQIDVLQFCATTCRAYIRFPGKESTKVHCALSLISSWDGVDIHIVFHKIAHSLLSLCVESLDQKHDVIEQL